MSPSSSKKASTVSKGHEDGQAISVGPTSSSSPTVDVRAHSLEFGSSQVSAEASPSSSKSDALRFSVSA